MYLGGGIEVVAIGRTKRGYGGLRIEALEGQIRFLLRRIGRLQHLTGIARSRARLRCHLVDSLFWWATGDLEVEFSPEAKMPVIGGIRVAPWHDRTRVVSAAQGKEQTIVSQVLISLHTIERNLDSQPEHFSSKSHFNHTS